MIYQMFDVGSDPYRYHPNVPVGSVHFHLWETLNPSDGVYNWAPIDEALKRELGWEGKPVQLLVLPYISSHWNWRYGFYDATPQWVYNLVPFVWLGGRRVGHAIDNGAGTFTSVPRYDSSVWRQQYYTFVEALGKRYDGHPQLGSVMVSAGLDGETQATKGATMTAIRGTAIEAGYGKFVYETMDAYAAAFNHMILYLNNAPGGRARLPRAEKAAEIGISLKHSGWLPDLDSHKGYGDEVGSWDMMRRYMSQLPMCIESAYGFLGPEHLYWMLWSGLHFHPKDAVLHSDCFGRMEPEWLEFLNDYLDVSPKTAPGAWCVLRDMEFPKQMWSSTTGISGHPGNWEFYLSASGGERIKREELPSGVDRAHVYSRQCRHAGEGIDFELDDAYAENYDGFTVTVTAMGEFSPFYFRDEAGEQESVEAWPSWETYFFYTEARRFQIQGNVFVHKVEVTGVLPEEPEPPDEEPPIEEPEEPELYCFGSEEEIVAWVNQQLMLGEVSLKK